MNSRISAPARESRFPVGSSAKMISGLLIERARDRDALLLAARQLGRPVGQPVAEPDGVDDLVRASRLSGRVPASDIGSVMFSTALRVGIRL